MRQSNIWPVAGTFDSIIFLCCVTLLVLIVVASVVVGDLLNDSFSNDSTFNRYQNNNLWRRIMANETAFFNLNFIDVIAFISCRFSRSIIFMAQIAKQKQLTLLLMKWATKMSRKFDDITEYCAHRHYLLSIDFRGHKIEKIHFSLFLRNKKTSSNANIDRNYSKQLIVIFRLTSMHQNHIFITCRLRSWFTHIVRRLIKTEKSPFRCRRIATCQQFARWSMDWRPISMSFLWLYFRSSAFLFFVVLFLFAHWKPKT